MNKKILFSLTSLLVITSLLGCGKNSNTSSTKHSAEIEALLAKLPIDQRTKIENMGKAWCDGAQQQGATQETCDQALLVALGGAAKK